MRPHRKIKNKAAWHSWRGPRGRAMAMQGRSDARRRRTEAGGAPRDNARRIPRHSNAAVPRTRWPASRPGPAKPQRGQAQLEEWPG